MPVAELEHGEARLTHLESEATAVISFFNDRRDQVKALWDFHDRTQMKLDQLELKKLFGQLDELDEANFGAYRHDVRTAFIRAAGKLGHEIAHTFPERGMANPIIIGGVPYMTEEGVLAKIDTESGQKETVVYDDHVFTNQQLDQGYRTATEEEWTGLFMGMLIEGAKTYEGQQPRLFTPMPVEVQYV